MRIFVAGASGVIGIRLVPLLIRAGHVVAAMTRSDAKGNVLRSLGATPVICDVYDRERLAEAVRAFGPDLVIDELTDLDDDPKKIDAAANARVRTEGTRNVLAAADGVRVITQSVAWQLDGEAGRAVKTHEQLVLDAGGVVIRYGQLYGPGTYHERDVPDRPRIHIDDAARRTLEALEAASGTLLTLVE